MLDARLIYLFIFPNKKKYVGQTGNFETRMKRHQYDAKEGIYLINKAIKKFGWESIAIIILHQNVPAYLSDILETLEILRHDSLAPNGYNLLLGGDSLKTHSKATRYHMARSPTRDHIWQYDLKTGNFIQEWLCSAQVTKSLNLCSGSVNNCVKKDSIKGNNFIWVKAKGSRPKNIYGKFKKFCSLPFFQLWREVMYQCYEPEYRKFYKYGKKGIKVCDEWKYNPEKFSLWVENNISIKSRWRLSLIDKTKDFSPENCIITNYVVTMKLTDNDVLDIKNLKNLIPTITAEEIAKAYNLKDGGHVQNILKGKVRNSDSYNRP